MVKTLSPDNDTLPGNDQDDRDISQKSSEALFNKKGNANSGELANLEADLDKKYSQDFQALDDSKGNIDSRDVVKEGEENPDTPSLYSADGGREGSLGKTGKLAAKLLAGSKRMGPTGGILGIIFGLFGITSVIGAPMSILTAFSDLTTNHTNVGNHLFIKSGNSYIASFLMGQGRNCATSKIKCKMTTISENQKKEWERRGIKVIGDKSAIPGITGDRYKVRGLEYKGTTVSSLKDYKNLKYSKTEFASKLKRFPVRAYLNEKGPFQNGTLKKFTKSLSERFTSSKEKEKKARAEANTKAMDGQTKADVGENGKASVDKVKSGAGSQIDKAVTEPSNKMKSFRSALGVAGGVSLTTVAACMAYNVVRAAQAGITLYWHQKLIDFALPFMQAGSQAKESGVNGGMDWETAEYFGDRLTDPITQKDIDEDPEDEITQDMLGKTAMDSKGVDAVINGSSADVNSGYAKDYTGWMPSVYGIGIVRELQDQIGTANISTACKVASVVTAVASVPACAAKIITCVVSLAAYSAAVSLWGDDILKYITDELSGPAYDAIAGANLTGSLKGPPLGQALVSAAGVMASYNNTASYFPIAGNSAEAETAYSDMYSDDDFIAMAKEEAAQNQFDVSNQYSFAGLVTSKLANVPLNGTITSVLANIIKLPMTAPSLLAANVSAAQEGVYQPVEIYSSKEKIEGTLNNCQNPSFKLMNLPCLGESGQTIPIFPKVIQDCMDAEENGGPICFETAVDKLSSYKYKGEDKKDHPYIDADTGEPSEMSGYKTDGSAEPKNPVLLSMLYCGRDRVYPAGYTDKTIEDDNENWHVSTNCAPSRNDDISPEKMAWVGYYLHMCIALYASEEGQNYCWDQTAAPAPSGGPWVAPTVGPCVSGFGQRWGTLHAGVDISPGTGTPIVAPTDMKIISAGGSSDGYGNSVVARATDGTNYMFRFGHMVDTPPVKAGQTVTKGTLIGNVGSSGKVTGPHLHFEVYDPSSPDGAYAGNGKPVDPVPIMAQHGVVIACS